MEIAFSSSFKKAFRKKINGTASEETFWRKIEVFTNDPYDVRLKAHKLSGKLKGLWSFSIEYDLRVVFYFTRDKPPKAIFIDKGDHDEVY
jgi:mRNA-degrading endonuclease YafQ of YafQ-DinJ toxin-antitoxin module